MPVAALIGLSIDVVFRTLIGYGLSRFFQPCRQQLEIEKLLDVERRCGHGLHVTRMATEANLKICAETGDCTSRRAIPRNRVETSDAISRRSRLWHRATGILASNQARV